MIDSHLTETDRVKVRDTLIVGLPPSIRNKENPQPGDVCVFSRRKDDDTIQIRFEKAEKDAS